MQSRRVVGCDLTESLLRRSVEVGAEHGERLDRELVVLTSDQRRERLAFWRANIAALYRELVEQAETAGGGHRVGGRCNERWSGTCHGVTGRTCVG